MKKIIAIASGMALMGLGSLPDIKFSAKDKRGFKPNPKGLPPRSMTDEEKEYFAIHKNLNGFKPTT